MKAKREVNLLAEEVRARHSVLWESVQRLTERAKRRAGPNPAPKDREALRAWLRIPANKNAWRAWHIRFRDEVFFLRMSFPSWREERAAKRLAQAKAEGDRAFRTRYEKEKAQRKRRLRRRTSPALPERSEAEEWVRAHWSKGEDDLPALVTLSAAGVLEEVRERFPNFAPGFDTFKSRLRRMGLRL